MKESRIRERSCSEHFQEFEAIAEGIVQEKAVPASDWGIGDWRQAFGEDVLFKTGQIRYSEGRMRFAGRTEILLDPEVQLHAAATEPHSTTRGEGLGLRDFLQTEDSSIECARGSLLARWHSHLDMIQTIYAECAGAHGVSRVILLVTKASSFSKLASGLSSSVWMISSADSGSSKPESRPVNCFTSPASALA